MFTDLLGQRYWSEYWDVDDDLKHAIVKGHIKSLLKELRHILVREHSTNVFLRIQTQAIANPSGKLQALAAHLTCPGPPLHVALNLVQNKQNRSALCALFSGDMLLGEYAANFFARSFTPKPTHRNHLPIDDDSDLNRACVFCWHTLRLFHLDDEAHACFVCPFHSRARDDLLMELGPQVLNKVRSQHSAEQQFHTMLSTTTPSDWCAVGKFLGRMRQARRNLRKQFTSMEKRINDSGFHQKKRCWLAAGKFVCRHGVFFNVHRECECMTTNPDWTGAQHMPYIDKETRALLTCRFERVSFRRLGQLQAQLRRLDLLPTTLRSCASVVV